MRKFWFTIKAILIAYGELLECAGDRQRGLACFDYLAVKIDFASCALTYEEASIRII